MVWFYVCVVFCTLCVWTVLENLKRRLDKRPPGSLVLPILGNTLCMLPAVINASKIKAHLKLSTEFVDKYLTYKPAYIVMDELTRKYGCLTSLQCGVNSAVIVGSSEYAKEVFCREEFADRFADGWFLERQFNKPLGLIFNNGKPYRAVKMFTMKHLKDFGMGRKENMEIAVEDELLDFLHDFQHKIETRGNLVNIHHTFTLPVLNILWEMVAGIRFSYDDKKLHQLISIVEEISRTHDLGGNILMSFPWLRFIAPELTGHSHQMRLYDELKKFFWDLLKNRMDEESYNLDCPRDFVDVFVKEIKKRKESNSQPENDLLTEEQFVIVCMDLFTAGSETTANTLEFALLYAMINPRVQKKVQEEIDDVIGQSRLPSMQDRQRCVIPCTRIDQVLEMPYTNATLLEAQRMCNVIPLAHRVAIRDTTLGPYRIKKDDVLITNMHTIHKDEKVWGDPTVFRPERFIDTNGNVISHEAFLPFGMGKRICMGEVLAKHTLFTYFTSILQRYNFQIPSDHEIPKLKPVKGFTISPDPVTALVTSRVCSS